MAGVRFSYKNNSGSTNALELRLAPTNVSWTYNLVTNIVDTYGGQVVQILAINIDDLVIEGQFGREGAYGRTEEGSHRSGIDLRATDGGILGVGLHQFVNYFRNYFAQATQGGDRSVRGRYNENFMKITYEDVESKEYYAGDIAFGTYDHGDEGIFAHRTWKVYPKSVPSFIRSNENFAPKWRVECEVFEADPTLKESAMAAEVLKIKELVGYKVNNPFSDPLALIVAKDPKEAEALIQSYSLAVVDAMKTGYLRATTALTDEDLDFLVDIAVSGPNSVSLFKQIKDSIALKSGGTPPKESGQKTSPGP